MAYIPASELPTQQEMDNYLINKKPKLQSEATALAVQTENAQGVKRGYVWKFWFFHFSVIRIFASFQNVCIFQLKRVPI